ncbi:MAG: aspartate/tyrosine/aromatic aminotransferase [Chloracidobacterium sp.]|nr:aspartate/tyrosine/aromatic aminotransferase [Chloracidobacterium sp.]
MITIQASPFAQIELAPPDPIIGLTEAFNNDNNPKKVSLGAGVYQDGAGKVPILKVVREAQERLLENEETKNYMPIDGIPAFNQQAQTLLLGADSGVLAGARAVTVQALGGTGALKVGADFLKRFFGASNVWISDPSWENHRQLFEAAGFTVNSYPYYDPETRGLDFTSMLDSLRKLPARSIVLLHACCHNPTGVDPSREEWSRLVDFFQTADLIPFFDIAYQGFGEGIDADAFAVRAFADAGVPCLAAQSFSKSFGLYRERVGALTIVTASEEEVKRVRSQLKRVIRTNYSSPASHGAHIVASVLADSGLRSRWEGELAEMRDRIRRMRELFVRRIREKGVEQDFSFIERQRGMFSYSELPRKTVDRLRSDYSIYIVGSGRVCVAALNEKNIDYVCEAIAESL